MGIRKYLTIGLATAGGAGLIPKAPGTWGSVVGVGVGLAAQKAVVLAGAGSGMPFYVAAILIWLGIIVISWKVTAAAEAHWNNHDDKRIVIDEVAGQMLVTMFFCATWTQVLLGFLLFRLFDIWKPGPIGWYDRQSTSWSTVADDLLAGLAALACLWVLTLILPGI